MHIYSSFLILFFHNRSGAVRCVLPCRGKFSVFWAKTLTLFVVVFSLNHNILLVYEDLNYFMVDCIHFTESAIKSKSHSLSQKVQMTRWSCELIWNFSYINPSPHFILGRGGRGAIFVIINITGIPYYNAKLEWTAITENIFQFMWCRFIAGCIYSTLRRFICDILIALMGCLITILAAPSLYNYCSIVRFGFQFNRLCFFNQNIELRKSSSKPRSWFAFSCERLQIDAGYLWPKFNTIYTTRQKNFE